VVAERRAHQPGDPGDAVVAFASAVERGPVSFLSMLFVEPDQQAAGLGRRLLERVLPHDGAAQPAMAAVADSAQPISNGLYGSYGVIPRLPLVHLVGRPTRQEALPELPGGVAMRPLAPGAELPGAVHALDREVLGFDHPSDHRFAIETGRQPYLVHGEDGRLLGYGYASTVGHVGPVAVCDAALLAPVAAALLSVIQPRGASACWVPGAASQTFSALIRSGLRIDGFPLLLCWSRPFADFERYLPLSPGLL
jgi:hypothetical protein